MPDIPTRTFPAALPPLAVLNDASGTHTASALQVRSGEETFLTGGNIDSSSGKPKLQPGPREIAYCIYQFDTPAGQKASQFGYTFADIQPGNQAWLAISNYTNGTWQFFGPLSASGTMPLSPPSTTYSNGTHTYIALLAWDGAEFTIDSVSLDLAAAGADWMHLNGDSGDGVHADCALNPDGNLWATGTAYDDFGDGIAVLMRYGPDGTLEYQKTWTSPHGTYANAIAAAMDGSIYVTGSLDAPGLGDPTLLLLKFDNNGAVLWSKAVSTPDENGQGIGLAVDTDGSAYLCGFQEDTFDGFQFAAKVSPAGEMVWAKRWPNGGFDIPRGMAITGGSIYVAGVYQDPISTLTTGLLLKFGLDGTSEWAKQWDCDTAVDGEDGYIFSPSLAADGSGNVIWSGSNLSDLFTGPPYTLHISLLRFQPDGTLIQQFGYQRESDDNYYAPVDILHDAAGDIFVPVADGFIGGSSQMLRFSAAGVYESDDMLVNASSSSDPYSVYGIASNAAGDIFGCGRGSRIADWQWEPVGGTSFTPAVVPHDFAGAIEDDTVNWTIDDMAGTLEDPAYTEDREADDMDALVFRAQFP